MSSLIVGAPSQASLTAAIAAQCHAEHCVVEQRRFPDGETYIRVPADPADRDVVYVAELARPDQHLIGTLLAIATLRDMGARSVTLVAPYLPYMRQDRRFRDGEAISARYVANLLDQHVDQLITVDPHLHRLGGLDELFTIPAHRVAAAPAIATWIANTVQNPVVVGPDAESAQWANAVAEALRAPSVVLTKERSGDHEVAVTGGHADALKEHTPVLVDDIISSGMTLVRAAERLRRLGAAELHCVGVHAVFAAGAAERLNETFHHVVSCDTIAHDSNAISVHALVAARCAELLTT